MRAVLLLAVLCVSAKGSATNADSPEATVNSFYAWKFKEKQSSLPKLDALRPVKSLLTPSILGLLERASAQEIRCVAATPNGVKPPLLEYDIYSGRNEPAESLGSVESHLRDGSAATVEVVFSATGSSPQESEYKWRGRVSLMQIGSSWQIDDFVYDDGSSLRRVLVDYLKDTSSCGGKQ